MKKLLGTRRRTPGVAAVVLTCVLATIALFAFVVAPPAAEANASPPADTVLYIADNDVGQIGTHAFMVSPSENGAVTVTLYIVINQSDGVNNNGNNGTANSTLAAANAPTAKAGGYDVICPITTAQNGQNTFTGQLTHNTATLANTVTVNRQGAYDAILPTMSAENNINNQFTATSNYTANNGPNIRTTAQNQNQPAANTDETTNGGFDVVFHGFNALASGFNSTS